MREGARRAVLVMDSLLKHRSELKQLWLICCDLFDQFSNAVMWTLFTLNFEVDLTDWKFPEILLGACDPAAAKNIADLS